MQDQYAFKATGSTNCALIKFIDYLTSRLENNDYVRCLLVDFSKAFDIVSHAVVIPKLNMLDMRGSIKNWIISFLTGRSQKVKVNGFLSNSQCINRSIVQGSGIGPFLYILMESDLHPLSQVNEILKYADDTNLLVPQHTDISMSVEYQNVMNWASRNKLTINSSKTKEIVFRRPHFRSVDIQPSFADIAMLDEVKLLGVVFTSKLTFNKHVNDILLLCNQCFYLLKLLRDQGMPLESLATVYHALVVNIIAYCLSS